MRQVNPNCFGEGDHNLPNCECRLIYERIRNAEKSVPSPHGDQLAVRNEQSEHRHARKTILGINLKSNDSGRFLDQCLVIDFFCGLDIPSRSE